MNWENSRRTTFYYTEKKLSKNKQRAIIAGCISLDYWYLSARADV